MTAIVQVYPGVRIQGVDLLVGILLARHARCGTAAAAVKYEVADAVKDQRALVEFDAVRLVRVMAEYHVGAGLDRGARDYGLIVLRLVYVVQAPVNRHHDDVDLGFKLFDVLDQRLEVVLVGRRDHARGGAWLVLIGLIEGVCAHRRRTGALFRCPELRQQHRAVAEEAYLQAVLFEDYRFARFRDVRAGAYGGYAQLLKRLHCADNRLGAPVADVVRRQR